MSIDELAERVAEELRAAGWSVDVKQRRCPQCGACYDLSKVVNYCSGCGHELVTETSGLSDLKGALRRALPAEE